MKVRVVLGLAITVSFIVVMAFLYAQLYYYKPFLEAISGLTINSFTLLVVSIFYVYIHRNWGRKLLKVKDAEKKLSEMLGGPIET